MKTVSKRNGLFFGILSVFVLSFVFYLFPKKSAENHSTPPITNTAILAEKKEEQKPVRYGLPARLIIPAMSLDAPVVYVGITPEGAMDIPKTPNEVGWYELGNRPGENGSAVIAGHYGTWENGQGSVFDELHTLRKGDTIYVEDDTGARTTFIVRESLIYAPNADASEVFTSTDHKSHLNLITCQGDWNSASKSYSERLVVFADKE